MGFNLGIYVNNSGTWVNPYRITVNDAGTSRDIKQVYVNDGGTWRSAYEFYPAISDDTTYSATATFTSRDNAPASATGYFRWVNTTDGTFTSKGWWTRVTVYQASGGFNSDTGWVAGNCGTNANQAYGNMYVPTKSGTGNSSLFSVPTLQARGSHFSNNWYARWCYSNEVTTFNNSLNSYPSDWIV